MKTHLLLSAALTLVLAGAASPQLTTDKGARSDQIQVKFHKMELLARIMPLALTKDQLNQLYPVIEKVRAEQRKLLSLEDDQLIKIEPQIDDAIQKAFEKGIYPSPENLTAVYRTFGGLAKNRQMLMNGLAEDFYDKVKSVFNKGQMTIMAKAVRDDTAPKEGSTDKDAPKDDKAQEAKDAESSKIFIKVVFLDPAAYDILVQLGKTPDPVAGH